MATTLSPLQPTLSGDSENSAKQSGTTSALQPSSKSVSTLASANISSPHELTEWVDNVLDQLESRFNTMSGQVESRMKEMSDRIDALESSIEDLITGVSAPLPSAAKIGGSEAETSNQEVEEA